MNTYDIINRLRIYPSIGMPGGDGLFGEGAFQDALNSLGTYIPNVNALAESIRLLTIESNNLQAGLESLSALQEQQNSTFLAGVKSVTFLLEREKDLAKTFGITAKASALLSAEYSKMSANLGISDALMGKYRTSINKILPGMSQNILRSGEYGKSLIRTNDLLQQHIGLTDDQTNALTLAAAATGTDLESSVNRTADLAKAMEAVTGETDTFQAMMKGVAETSLDLRVEYSKFPGSLEVATLKARRLGMSMDDIDKSATSLLDIESSVGKELEYQLISGKRLVDVTGKSLTNKLREAKLSSNPLDAANAMTEILTSQQEILEHGNYLQKQALADAVGLSVEQMQGANAQMKLQDKIYEKMQKSGKPMEINGREIKSAVELTMADLQSGMDKFGEAMGDKEKADATAELKRTQSLITPAEKQVALLQSIVDDGIRVYTSDSTALLETLNKSIGSIAGARKEFDKGTAYTKQPAAPFGKSQTISQMATGFIDNIENYIEAKTYGPITTPLINAAKIVVSGLITTMHGKKVPPTETVAPVQSSDALMMHDGIIQFDDRDKFTMIASPYGAMHESVADKITGKSANINNHETVNTTNNNINSLDVNSMAAAMQMAIQSTNNTNTTANDIAKAIQSAIQASLGNVSWTVNLDPMAVDKAIKFSSGRLNS